MSAVLGIDVSSHAIDLVRLNDNGDATWERCPLEGKTSFDRLRDVQTVMPRGSWYDDLYLIAIERPKTRFMPSAAALFPVFGAVVARLPSDIELWDVRPTDWRKGLGIAGNASKDDAREAVWKLDARFTGLTELDGPPQDAIDAYAVAYYARELNARGIAIDEAREKQLTVI